MSTMFCDCGETINSRPLNYVTDNKEDHRTTPAMFLQKITEIEIQKITV